MTPIKLPACERLPSTLCIRSSKDECPPLLTHTNSQALCKSTCWNDSIETLKKTCAQEYPERAMYVQGSIDSRNSAIHNAYHTSLRPSSSFEPRHPSLKVVFQQHCAKVPKNWDGKATRSQCGDGEIQQRTAMLATRRRQGDSPRHPHSSNP